ncbi:large conductance mechanosensitive channel protein MscL [Singulisphaera sp. PoT]|uniref:large conductance mechanosensitive channel protein MscL n=1 Tax=Singulisphaera sp. PoT TaxID=3411797 RepID=UPI003BF4607E
MDLKSLAPTKQALSLIEGFKAFAFKGNVIDLAVGVIIGGAFGKLVSSMVDNILMPVVGVIMPGQKGYEGWVAVVGDKKIPYGKFLGDTVNFLIVAMALYLFVVKLIGWITAYHKEETAKPPTKEEALLTEIRDLLKSQKSTPSP